MEAVTSGSGAPAPPPGPYSNPHGHSHMDASKQSAATAEPEVGTAFAGRYLIIRLLGQGDRKFTYLAKDMALGRTVALALIKPEAARADPAGTGREAETLVQAGNHDNIVTLYDRGTAGDVEYLVFAYLAGGTLREYLDKRRDRKKPLSGDEAMRLGRQVGRALSHLHGHGLVHRDVAPANIWLDERRVAHLGDFDSAVQRGAPQDPDFFPPTTEAYAAPEQATSGWVDERSDLYSLGAVLYEAVTGELPHGGSGGDSAKRLSELRGDLPPGLRRTIRWLLADSPDDRPANAAELLHALKPTHASRAEGVVPWTETLPFPLASILWRYDGEPDPPAKVDLLLKFFEALAQFRAMVTLSACVSDPVFLDAHRSAWLPGADEPRALDLRRPTFGVWVELSERLAQTCRSLSDRKAGVEDKRHRLFAASELDLVEAFISRDLTKILLRARDLRNSWSGHGGVAGAQIHGERLCEAEDLLAKTTDLLTWSFETWTLVRPGAATFSGGIYDLTATILTGPNLAFRKKQIRLARALDATRLYLVNDGSPNALELVPLIRVMPSGKTGQDACYFYNRLQDDQVRWVSYHFHTEPELILPDTDIIELLASLSPGGPIGQAASSGSHPAASSAQDVPVPGRITRS